MENITPTLTTYVNSKTPGDMEINFLAKTGIIWHRSECVVVLDLCHGRLSCILVCGDQG